MTAVRFSAEAEADIDHIFRWTAADSVDAASKIIADFEGACAELASFPERYPVRAKPRQRALRRRPIGRYNIYYEINARGVEIVRIVHSAREVMTIFPED